MSLNEIYPVAPVTPLTEEERKNPYAFLYDWPIPDPDPEIAALFAKGNEMDVADTIKVTELERVFLPDMLPVRNGYCQMPDGTTYTAVNVHMPDLTREMEEFWMSGWLGQDDVHYKVWFPGRHYSHKIPVTEDLGWGVGNINFARPLILPKLLSAMPAQLDPSFVGFSGCAGFFRLLDNPEDIWYNTIVNVVKESPKGGLEIQVVNWGGIHNIDGEAVFKIPEGEKDELERARLYGCHALWEDTRKNQILPEIMKISKQIGAES